MEYSIKENYKMPCINFYLFLAVYQLLRRFEDKIIPVLHLPQENHILAIGGIVGNGLDFRLVLKRLSSYNSVQMEDLQLLFIDERVHFFRITN